LSESDNGIQFADVEGDWAGRVVLADGTEQDVSVAFWHRRNEDLSNIAIQRHRDFLPTVLFRGDGKLETSKAYNTSSNFRKLLVGELTDDGQRIEGWLVHYAWDQKAVEVTLHKEE
jgi:hypothetical protein